MHVLFYSTVWGTPLVIAVLAMLCLRREMLSYLRLAIWVTYIAWSSAWLWLWTVQTRRTRELTWEELIFVVGFWVAPVAGLFLLCSAEFMRRRERGGRGFEIITSEGFTNGKDSDSR